MKGPSHPEHQDGLISVLLWLLWATQDAVNSPEGTDFCSAQCLQRSAEKSRPLPVPTSTRAFAQLTDVGRGQTLWGKLGWAAGFLGLESWFSVNRVEEVNWAAWEQTLPTVCEDPTGEGIPGE